MKSEEKWEDWIRAALKGSHLHEPPEGALRRALALGSQLPGRRPAGLGWVAELIFDSAAEPLPVGVRGAAAEERRVLYQLWPPSGADLPCQLDLRVRRTAAADVEVTGQLLPPLGQGRVEARVGRTRRSQAMGNSGEFLLRKLPLRAETLDLEIHGTNGEPLVIAGVPLLSRGTEPS